MMSPISALLRTKLYRPYLAADFVHRSRLIDRINRRIDRPLTLVSAPAGYGKSSLVSDWCETSELPVAWLSLDEDDNDPARFVDYVAAAVETLFPDAFVETRALLDTPSLPVSAELARTLLNEVAQIAQHFALVLDDYHLIHMDEIHRLIADLLRFPTGLLHLILISRRDPPLPLHLLRGQGRITEVRTADLRFTASETGAFLYMAMNDTMSDQNAVTLTEKTEGWVTGLRLAMLSIERDGTIMNRLNRLPRDLRHVTDYLLNEVLDHLPTDTQEFLLKTSVLDRLCGPLCDALVDYSSRPHSSRTQLEALHRQNLFMISLDPAQDWFRYHHLFQHLLQDQLQAKMPDAVPDLHRRAAAWFEENGLLDEAIRHALAAGDGATAIRIVEENRHVPQNEDRWYVLQRWLDLLPARHMQERPSLLMAQAWIALYRNELSGIPPLLLAIDDLGQLQEETAPILLGEKVFLEGMLHFWSGAIAPGLQSFQRALELLPPSHSGARSEAEVFVAVSSAMAGDAASALASCRQDLHAERTNLRRKIRLKCTIVFIHLLQGSLIEAQRAAVDVVESATVPVSVYMDGIISHALGCIHYAWNNLEEACRHFGRAVRHAHLLPLAIPIDAYAGLIMTLRARGMGTDAADRLQEMAVFAQQSENAYLLHLSHSVEARALLLHGDLKSAKRRLALSEPDADTGNVLWWLDLPRLTECRVLLAEGTDASVRSAIDRLRKHLAFSQATTNVPQSIGILCLLASAYLKQEQGQEAMEALNQAVTLAQPGGWLRPFIDAGPELAAPLSHLRQEGGFPAFINEILDGFAATADLGGNSTHLFSDGVQPVNGRADVIMADGQLLELLTQREVDVLMLLAQRLTNQEIAAELNVTVATVKKHSSNIYQKLNVRNRRQAVTRAMAAGLLPRS